LPHLRADRFEPASHGAGAGLHAWADQRFRGLREAIRWTSEGGANAVRGV